MALSLIQTPSFVSLSNNYNFIVTDPTTAYSGLTNYYVQYELVNLQNSTTIIKDNVNVYNSVYGGYAIYDTHRVLNNYVTYDTAPLLGALGFYSTINNIFHYGINAYEFTGSTLLSSTINIFSGLTILGVVDRNVTFNYVNYIMDGPNKKFRTNWIYPYYTRKTDRGSLSFAVKDFTSFKYRMRVEIDGNQIWWSAGTPLTGNTQDRIQYFGSGYYEVDHTFFTGATGLGFNILSSVSAKTYKMFLVNDGVGQVIQSPLSEVVKFVVDDSCPLIENIELMWLNEMGAYDFYTFYRERHKEYKSTKTLFNKKDYGLSNGSLIVPQYSRGEVTLNNNIVTNISVISKVLDNNMSKNISGLFTSPEVYWLNNDVTPVEINPITIDMETLEIKDNKNRPDRAIYTFNFRLSNEKNTITN